MRIPCEIVTQIHADVVKTEREFRYAVALRDSLLLELLSGRLA